MSEKAVADFVGRSVVDPASGAGDAPRESRIVMSRRRLVVATDDRLTVPLAAVRDVTVGEVPSHLRDVWDDTVAIVFQAEDGDPRRLVIEGEPDTMARFADVLFKCLLNGTVADVVHGSRVDGRVTGRDVDRATLSVDGDRLTVSTEDASLDLDVESVVDVARFEDGAGRATVRVTHLEAGEVLTSTFRVESPRTATLLGRYLRTEYARTLHDVDDVDLSGTELRALVTVYATDGDPPLERVLDVDAATAASVRESLLARDLVEASPDGVVATRAGQVVVHDRFLALDE